MCRSKSGDDVRSPRAAEAATPAVLTRFLDDVLPACSPPGRRAAGPPGELSPGRTGAHVGGAGRGWPAGLPGV